MYESWDYDVGCSKAHAFFSNLNRSVIRHISSIVDTLYEFKVGVLLKNRISRRGSLVKLLFHVFRNFDKLYIALVELPVRDLQMLLVGLYTYHTLV